MAMYRTVTMGFWTDVKVVDDYTPEERYFMLWALTNNYTNIIGCYEVSIKQIARDLGYDPNSNIIENILKRFIYTHKSLDYDFETKELFVKNWNKYNWTNSVKLEQAIIEGINNVKSLKFKREIADIYNSRDTLSIPYVYPIEKDITVTVTNTITNTVTNTNTIIDIIKYLNIKIDSNYKATNKVTCSLIKARLNEKFTLDNFKTVIDKKSKEWLNTEFSKYLRPDTLFGNKFESYLNQKESKKSLKDLSMEDIEEAIKCNI